MKHFEKSLRVTQTVVIILSIIFVIILFSAPYIFPIYCNFAGKSEAATHTLIGVFYGCSPSAAVTLIFTYKFLNNLQRGNVFTEKSVKYLRILSYACLSAIPLSLPLCFYFLAAFPIPAAAGFMWLIVRVIKNAFEYGSEIKNENDLTV